MIKNYIYRHAPAPKPGQDRVYETIQIAMQEALGVDITKMKDDHFLGQGILGEGVETKIRNEMDTNPYDGDKVKSQDMAIGAYLNGKIGNPLADAQGLMQRFTSALQHLNFPYIKKNKENIQPGLVFGKFVMIRHGDKGTDGNLSNKGKEEAKSSGKKIRSDHKDMIPTGYFGVQQPINQMIMMACIAGKNKTELANQDNLSTLIWNMMPEAWQIPYQTGEVTVYELSLSEGFNREYFAGISDNQKDQYIRDKIKLKINRNNHPEAFSLTDIDTYLSIYK